MNHCPRMIHQSMTNHPIRVLLLIPHLAGGGAEQVIALLACGLAAEQYQVHLGLVTQGQWPPPRLPKSVVVHDLGVRRVRNAPVRLLRLVRAVRPDVILSGMAHLNFLVLLLRPLFSRGIRVVVRQNITISAVLAAAQEPRGTALLYRLLYPRADRILCPTQAMADDLASMIPVAPGRLVVLPNPIDTRAIAAALAGPFCWHGPGPHLLAIGRLSPEKGFDLLIEAMAMVRGRFPAADLTLVGAGSEETRLRQLTGRLHLDSAVWFAGYIEQPYVLYPGTSCFVLPSRYEGMPNALLEADAAGLPMVATPASGGVIDLMRGRPGAWLASAVSASALADALIAALGSLQPGQRFPRETPGNDAVRSYAELIDSICVAGSA